MLKKFADDAAHLLGTARRHALKKRLQNRLWNLAQEVLGISFCPPPPRALEGNLRDNLGRDVEISTCTGNEAGHILKFVSSLYRVACVEMEERTQLSDLFG